MTKYQPVVSMCCRNFENAGDVCSTQPATPTCKVVEVNAMIEYHVMHGQICTGNEIVVAGELLESEINNESLSGRWAIDIHWTLKGGLANGLLV